MKLFKSQDIDCCTIRTVESVKCLTGTVRHKLVRVDESTCGDIGDIDAAPLASSVVDPGGGDEDEVALDVAVDAERRRGHDGNEGKHGRDDNQRVKHCGE